MSIETSPSFALDLFLPGQYTVATLPSAATFPRKYAWVTDLFGGPGDYCISDGTSWKPVRPLSVQSPAASDMTLTALLSAPTQIITGTIGTAITRTVALSTQYAYLGARFRVVRAAGGIGALVVGVTGLSINAWADMEFNGTAWVQTASGGLL